MADASELVGSREAFDTPGLPEKPEQGPGIQIGAQRKDASLCG